MYEHSAGSQWALHTAADVPPVFTDQRSTLEKRSAMSAGVFQQATAACHKNKIIVYFESHSSLYTHGNEASVHPSTEATIHNIPFLLKKKTK